jgi:hypothetical protein
MWFYLFLTAIIIAITFYSRRNAATASTPRRNPPPPTYNKASPEKAAILARLRAQGAWDLNQGHP